MPWRRSSPSRSRTYAATRAKSAFPFIAQPPSGRTNRRRLTARLKPAQVGSVVFKYDLPPGVYAVNAFHDENNNGKFATNFIGLPLEGYGFSNDVRPNLLSAPSFNKAAFELLPVGGVIHFGLVYP